MGIFGSDATREDYLRLEARVQALEQTVARLSAAQRSAPPGPPVHSGSPVEGQVGTSAAGSPPSWDMEARALAAQGKKIHAIKVVREATSWRLQAAKDYVDRM